MAEYCCSFCSTDEESADMDQSVTLAYGMTFFRCSCTNRAVAGSLIKRVQNVNYKIYGSVIVRNTCSMTSNLLCSAGSSAFSNGTNRRLGLLIAFR